ncbi:PREDICTED: uncharacterized protein LOC109477617 [Branchiostoma belcheri]|uniref:Uncharacterized protein LOC109477617 n=1 Tax=Branchiostoma belcheri TaxID=7741 RepID=A0A6P4ZY61_BRABE|nr:PREDICTED: uncharacterized protein LOC109477617 [Branchiostoma belcheri]
MTELYTVVKSNMGRLQALTSNHPQHSCHLLDQVLFDQGAQNIPPLEETGGARQTQSNCFHRPSHLDIQARKARKRSSHSLLGPETCVGFSETFKRSSHSRH